MSRNNQITRLAAIVTKTFALRSKLSYHTNQCHQIFKQIDQNSLFTITPLLIKQYFHLLDSEEDIASFFRHHRIKSSSYSYIDFFKAFFQNKVRLKNEEQVTELIRNVVEQELIFVKIYGELSSSVKNQQLIKYIEDNQKLYKDQLIQYTWSLIEGMTGSKIADQLQKNPTFQIPSKTANNSPVKNNYLEEIKQLQVQYRQKKKFFEQFEQDAIAIQKKLELIMDQAVKNIDKVAQIKANPNSQIQQVCFMGQTEKVPLDLRSANNFFHQDNYSDSQHFKFTNLLQDKNWTHLNNYTEKLNPNFGKAFLNQGYLIHDSSRLSKQNIQMGSRYKDQFKNSYGKNFSPEPNQSMIYKLVSKQLPKQIHNPTHSGLKKQQYKKNLCLKPSYKTSRNSTQNFKQYSQQQKFLQYPYQQDPYHQQFYPSSKFQQPFHQQSFPNQLYLKHNKQIKKYHQYDNHYKMNYGNQGRQSRMSSQKYFMENFKEGMVIQPSKEQKNQNMVSSMSQPKKFNPYRDHNPSFNIRNQFYKRKYQKQIQKNRNYNNVISRVKSLKLL